ncbi:hypothetical protein [Anaeromyxobacter paludicola]|uniref:Uncharacterized protein n=1 Tax=Anaeromyxobacter paludicola TaxID=2918171 RepID=A0ABM7XFJ5_9BACT|nr:hypothetical protein [Anaeromyxobacter paludicola]BDG10646.1 hypothetical protein AMPC_37590 [Anaeromyxobacter paludicola]
MPELILAHPVRPVPHGDVFIFSAHFARELPPGSAELGEIVRWASAHGVGARLEAATPFSGAACAVTLEWVTLDEIRDFEDRFPCELQTTRLWPEGGWRPGAGEPPAAVT